MMPRSARPTGLRFDRRVLDEAHLVEPCRLVFRRHDRLERLIWLRAPEIIMRNEKRMLNAAVVALRSMSETTPKSCAGGELHSKSSSRNGDGEGEPKHAFGLQIGSAQWPDSSAARRHLG